MRVVSGRGWGGWLGVWLALGCLLALAGCGGGSGARTGVTSQPARYYPPPGPPEDPWGPYIGEAASRFSIPGQWVRAVMHQESGGQQQAVSSVGAMGLMQLMPATWDGLRQQYGLGDDPFEPHDNIMAGSGYLKQLYDQFGAPAFLAAYNAGPQRLSDYLNNDEPLPSETVGYLAAVTPNLGAETALTGPLAVYGGGSTEVASAAVPPTPRMLASGCDPDAAYDPVHPCRVLEQAAASPAPTSVAVLDSAAVPQGEWAVQVGAFASEDLARSMAARAQSEAPDLLGGAAISVPTTTPFGGRVLFRARLVALSQTLASLACHRLNASQFPCIVVRPGGIGA